MSKKILSHQATILGVSDIKESLKFYLNKLGFECTFEWENPPTYAVIKRDSISLHLTKIDNVQKQKTASIYIFSHDINELYSEFQNKNNIFEEDINTAEYGMREFTIKDSDGNKIIFGQES